MANLLDESRLEVREDLSYTIEEFDLMSSEDGYVGHKILPAMPKPKKKGSLIRVPLEQMVQDLPVNRNADQTFPFSRLEVGDDMYRTQNKGHATRIDKEALEEYNDLFDAETYEQKRITYGIRRAFEREVVGHVTDFNNYDASRRADNTTGGSTGGGMSNWSSRASATVYADVDAEREKMFLDLGAEPNAMFMSRADFRRVIDTEDVQARSRSQDYVDVRPKVLNRNTDSLAEVVDIEKVYAANSLRNRGTGRDLQRIWPNGIVVLAKVKDPGNVTDIGYGYSPVWSKMGMADRGMPVIWAESYDEHETCLLYTSDAADE